MMAAKCSHIYVDISQSGMARNNEVIENILELADKVSGVFPEAKVFAVNTRVYPFESWDGTPEGGFQFDEVIRHMYMDRAEGVILVTDLSNQLRSQPSMVTHHIPLMVARTEDMP